MFFLETGSTDPRYNLAFEEYILTNRRDGEYLLLWQNANTVVVGQNQNTEEEINKTFVEEHQIQVVRRSTGGGAVYHDMGNLNYSFITDVGEAENLTLSHFTEPVVSALRALGLEAESSGRNDILVDGCKVSGTAQRISGGRILHHGTLLFDSNPDMIAGALNADPEKFKSKSTKSVRSRVGNIRDSLVHIGRDMSIDEFKDHLKAYFKADTENNAEIALSEAEIQKIRELKAEKYDTWEWNFGKSPKYDFKNRKRFPGGSVEVRVSVEKGGHITEAKFYGDFLSVKALDELEEALTGVSFEKKELEKVLDGFRMAELFGSITKDEILSLF